MTSAYLATQGAEQEGAVDLSEGVYQFYNKTLQL
jgi:hypothetical protein